MKKYILGITALIGLVGLIGSIPILAGATESMFVLPTSTVSTLLASVNATFQDAGFLLLLGIVIGLPLFFWVVGKIISLIPKKRG